MRTLDDGRIQVRCRVTGTYRGKPFVYEDPKGDQGSLFIEDDDAGEFWWAEGNMSCDCNRARFVGIKRKVCGETIKITKVEPIEGEGLPSLYLNEE